MAEARPGDLRFVYPRAADAALLFGADTGSAANDLTVTGSFGALTAQATVTPLTDLALAGACAPLVVRAVLSVATGLRVAGLFAPLAATASAAYHSNTPRPTVGAAPSAWRVGRPAPASPGRVGIWQVAAASPQGWCAPWAAGDTRARLCQLPHPHRLRPDHVNGRVRARDGQALGTLARLAHQDAGRTHLARRGGFADATQHGVLTCFHHQDGDHRPRAGRATRWQVAVALAAARWSAVQPAAPFPQTWHGRYQEAVPPPPGRSWTEPPGPPPPPGCYDRTGDLLFEALVTADGPLVFICDQHPTPPPPEGRVVVPIRRIYCVLNTVTLTRVEDQVEVPCHRLALSLEAGSWTWGCEASLPSQAQSLVAPGRQPVELDATVNGQVFRFLVESLVRERRFGQSTIRVSGRGRAALLDAPYVPEMTFTNAYPRTAQQLMADVLTVNGVSLDWTIDWGLEDWSVPAGVFHHVGTYISALVTIAQSAGGYLIPDPSAPRLQVRARYPVAPWDWGGVTPDIVLPEDAVAQESLRWRDKPRLNRVYVSGAAHGVLGRVTRAGTAGDVLAPMVVDPLITTAAAARQRGLSILADTGLQIELGLRLPVWPETGVIQPGTFLRYIEAGQPRLGLVRSTQVEAALADVWQTVAVLSHA